MNENIKILLDKVSGDDALLAKFSACKTVDEAYDLASSLVGGYTKEEFCEVMTALNAADDADISDEDLAEAAGGNVETMLSPIDSKQVVNSVVDSVSAASKSVVQSAKQVSKWTEEAAKSVAKSVTKVSKALAV